MTGLLALCVRETDLRVLNAWDSTTVSAAFDAAAAWSATVNGLASGTLFANFAQAQVTAPDGSIRYSSPLIDTDTTP